MATADQEQAEHVEEHPAPKAKRPRKGDEQAYEDSWYQVLRRLAPEDDED